MFWNPDRTDIKTAQGFAVTQALSKFMEDLHNNNFVQNIEGYKYILFIYFFNFF